MFNSRLQPISASSLEHKDIQSLEKFLAKNGELQLFILLAQLMKNLINGTIKNDPSYLRDVSKLLESNLVKNEEIIEKHILIALFKIYTNQDNADVIIKTAEALLKKDFKLSFKEIKNVISFEECFLNLAAKTQNKTAAALLYDLAVRCVNVTQCSEATHVITKAARFYLESFETQDIKKLRELAKFATQVGDIRNSESKQSSVFKKDYEKAKLLFQMVIMPLLNKAQKESIELVEDFFNLFEKMMTESEKAFPIFKYHFLRAYYYISQKKFEKASELTALYKNDPAQFSQFLTVLFEDEMGGNNDGEIVPRLLDVILFLNQALPGFKKEFSPTQLIDDTPLFVVTSLYEHEKLLNYYCDQVEKNSVEWKELNETADQSYRAKNCTALFMAGLSGNLTIFNKLIECGFNQLYFPKLAADVEPFVFQLLECSKSNPLNEGYYHILRIVVEHFPSELNQTFKFEKDLEAITIKDFIDRTPVLFHLRHALIPKSEFVQKNLEKQIRRITIDNPVITALLSGTQIKPQETIDDKNVKITRDYLNEKIQTLETLIHPENGAGKWKVSFNFFKDVFQSWKLECKTIGFCLSSEDMPIIDLYSFEKATDEVHQLAQFVTDVYEKSRVSKLVQDVKGLTLFGKGQPVKSLQVESKAEHVLSLDSPRI